MAYSVNWVTKVISVPTADLSLITGTQYALYLDAFRIECRRLESAFDEGLYAPDILAHTNTRVNFAGSTYAPFDEVINGYTIEFTGVATRVDLIGSNNNVIDKFIPSGISVVPSNAAGLIGSLAIEFGEFGGGVTIDQGNVSGKAVGGSVYPTGTNRQPSSNIPDTVVIAGFRGFSQIFVLGDLALSDGHDVRGYHMVGRTHINTVLTVDTLALCLKTRFTAFDITGVLDGESEIKDCIVRGLEYFNGHIHDSYLTGTITLSGSLQANIADCKILDVLSPPIIDCGGSGQNLMMPNYSGRVVVDNLTGSSNIAIGLDAGEVVINSTCTSGVIAVSGSGRVIDNSGDNCYVVDTTTDGSEVHNLKSTIELMRPHHTGLGKTIFWDVYGGNDAHSGDHENRATKTFAKAHTLAADNGHDVIVCMASNPAGVTIATENCIITKNYLFVRSAGRDFIGHSIDDSKPVFDVQANGVEISSMQVTTNPTNTVAAIKIAGSFPLVKDVFIGESANGILINGGSFGIIENCRISHGSGYGLRVEGASEHFNVVDSHIGSNAGDGVQLAMSSGHEVYFSHTIIHGNGGYGIDIEAGTNATLIDSDVTIYGNTLGDVSDTGDDTYDASNGQKVATLTWEEPKATALIKEVHYIERWIHIDTEQLTQGIGTQKEPFNTWDATITYMEANNLLRVHTVSDLTLDRRTKNFVIAGVGSPIIDFNGQNIDGSQFEDCKLSGNSTGFIKATNCDLLNDVQLSGKMKECSFMGVVEQTGDTLYSSCESGITGLAYPQLKITSGDAAVRGFVGSLGLTGVAAGEHSIGIASDGRFLADVTCTGGHLHVRGFPFDIVDETGIGCTVFDETESKKVSEMPVDVWDEVL